MAENQEITELALAKRAITFVAEEQLFPMGSGELGDLLSVDIAKYHRQFS
jgi:hypothetical protein